MGSGAKTNHQSYVTAPAVTASPGVPEGIAGIGGAGAFAGEVLIGQVPAAGIEAAQTAHDHVEGFCSTDFGNDYEAFLSSLTAAKSALETATDGGAGQLLTSDWDAVKEKCKEFTASLSPEELEIIAAAQGFKHPGLLGLSYDGTGAHPLAFVVNPYYPPDSPNKLVLQQKAWARWEALAAGEVVGGMTLADYKAKFPEAVPKPKGPGAKSPDELLAIHSQLDALSKELLQLGWFVDEETKKIERANLRYAYQRLLREYQAPCDDPAFHKPTVTAHGIGLITSQDLPFLYERLSDDYGLSPMDAHILLDTHQLNTYLREGTPEAKTLGDAIIATKKSHFEALKTHLPFAGSKLAGDKFDLPQLSSATQPEVVAFCQHLVPYLNEVNATGVTLLASPPFKQEVGDLSVGLHSLFWNKEKYFRAWAKEQSLPQLRLLATNLGATATECKKWTRATIQNYIAGTFSHKAKAAFEKATTPKPVGISHGTAQGASTVSATAAKTATHATSQGTGSESSTAKSLHGIQVPKHAKFAAKRTAVAEGLAHLAASINAVASRPTAAEVESLELSPTTAPVSGGAHSKTFFADGSGRVWMFKPDSSGGGARATAEATASTLLHKAGLSSVPVYTRSIGGKKGSIQPIIEGTKTIDASPSSWSQADVDSIVRYHVGAWMVGDHDGNPANVLRTKGGGLIPVDQGQAWKFVGRDRLDVDYHPNSSFGSIPVYHTAYKAAKHGGLANGVRIRPEAAAPVIARFESLPDDDLREMVRPLAAEGVKTGLPWKAPMAEVAKKRFATTSPSPKQIAEAFVETIVERKKTLRKDFTAFFSGLGFESAGVLEEVA